MSWGIREIGDATVFKWWQCPLCGGETLCLFRGAPPHPLELLCPSCHRLSPIPWPQATVYRWTCSICGHVQLVGVKTWDSGNRVARTEIGSKLLQCQVCNIPPVGPGLTAWHQFWNEAVFTGTAEEHAKRLAAIRNDTAAFEHWIVREVPRLLAERREAERLRAEENRLRELALQQQMQTLAGLREMNPEEFEKAVGSLCLVQGWQVFLTPGSGDRGIDLVLLKGNKKVAVQCKKYKGTVSERLVREFYGSFVGGFTKGVFYTTSSYSRTCHAWAQERKSLLTLVDGKRLAELMARHKPPRVEHFEIWSSAV